MEEIPPLDQNRILINPEKLEKDLIFENGKLKTILTISQKRCKANSKAWIDTGATVSLISKKFINKNTFKSSICNDVFLKGIVGASKVNKTF